MTLTTPEGLFGPTWARRLDRVPWPLQVPAAVVVLVGLAVCTFAKGER